MNRLDFVASLGALVAQTATPVPYYDRTGAPIPIRADPDRLVNVTVCTRPFRAAGPRLDVETVGEKIVAHNYGHGGSGWSLSWGSADVAVRKIAALANGERELAVIGCGAIGLTSAITAQRMGFRVTIYAKDLPPFVRSARATGSWTPSSRIALASGYDASFPARWEGMARTALAMHESFLGSADVPVEWTDRWHASNLTQAERRARRAAAAPRDHHEFADLEDRIADLEPGWIDLDNGDASNPFPPMRYVSRTSTLTFNVAAYQRRLMNDFLGAGGSIVPREFATPRDLAALAPRCIINCTGYGARSLWSDESIVPVRGQIGWLPPQEGVHYGLYLDDLLILARRDGIAVQPSPLGDDTGWNDPSEAPDRAAAIVGVAQLRAFYDQLTPHA